MESDQIKACRELASKWLEEADEAGKTVTAPGQSESSRNLAAAICNTLRECSRQLKGAIDGSRASSNG